MNVNKGFTLIELMITVFIVAIIAAVAIPSYQGFVLDGRRAECMSFALDIASRQERNWTQAGTYVVATSATEFTNGLSTTNGNLSDNGFCTATTTGGDSFLITVTPDIADPECVNLTLTNTGVRGVGTGSTSSAAECWR